MGCNIQTNDFLLAKQNFGVHVVTFATNLMIGFNPPVQFILCMEIMAPEKCFIETMLKIVGVSRGQKSIQGKDWGSS